MLDTTKRPLTIGQAGGIQLRYGENAWQEGNFFTDFGSTDPLGLGNFVLEEGEIPSATNLTDLDRGIRTIVHIAAALEKASGGCKWHSAIALKHGNCCGAGFGVSPDAALNKMILGDLQAIMGAAVVVNFPVGLNEASKLLHTYCNPNRRLLDVVVAPSFSESAKETLARKAGKCRLLSNSALENIGLATLDPSLKCRSVRRGYIVQSSDSRVLDLRCPGMKVFGRAQSNLSDIAFASAICRTSNSNTITLVRDGMLIGNGVGQTRRDRAARLAITIAQENSHDTRGAVACSDSFFPFADGVEPLIKAGISTIFATSGSVRDAEVQKACIDAGVTLYQLPDRDARMFFGH